VYTFTNAHGLEVRAITYGGIIVSLKVPDKTGHLDDVALGYDSLAGYIENPTYFGAIIGRYGNRIAGAKFTLDGKTYSLAANNGPNSLHGGLHGFNKALWTAESFQNANSTGLIFTYTSKTARKDIPAT